jgi:hypothetical protein
MNHVSRRIGFLYRLKLKKNLNRIFLGKCIEVNNCVTRGFTSAKVLIKFLLESIDLELDMTISYPAYNGYGTVFKFKFQKRPLSCQENFGVKDMP